MAIQDSQTLCYQMAFEESIVDILHRRLFGRTNSKPWREFSTFDLVCVSVSCDPIEDPKYIYVVFQRPPRGNWFVRLLDRFGRLLNNYGYSIYRFLFIYDSSTAFFRTRMRVDYNTLPLANLELISGSIGPRR